MLINFEHLDSFKSGFPSDKAYTLLGHQQDWAALPPLFQAQIAFFPQAEVGDFLYTYLHQAPLVTGPAYAPFRQGDFKTIDQCDLDPNDKALKKWLYEHGLPFAQWVYVLGNYQGPPMTMTWKMVLKLAPSLFVSDDIAIFDQTGQWCLFYFHEGIFFFGNIRLMDASEGYAQMERLIKHKKRFPHFRLPYYNDPI